MHDPCTVAFEIRSPFKDKHGYRKPLITVWHVDPEKDGTDDSCGWFARARHGDPKMLDRIKKSIEMEFDGTFKGEQGTIYYRGYFSPNSGMPNMSVSGITLDMFSKAAWEFFKHDRKKQKRWMKKNLYDILHFAENTTDSLRDEINGTWRIGTGTQWNREESLSHYASVIYGWLLRSQRTGFKHPRWHIHHWKIQRTFWRFLKKKQTPVDYVLRNTLQ